MQRQEIKLMSKNVLRIIANCIYTDWFTPPVGKIFHFAQCHYTSGY